MYVFSTKKILFLFFLLFIFSLSLNAKNLVISGNYKLSLDDIQFLSNIDIKSSSLNINDINSLLIDLKNSELINDVSFEEQVNFYSISITEEKFIENIFINGNIFIQDDDILNNISLSKGKLFNKDTIYRDSQLIKNIYLSQGFFDANLDIKIEKFSEDKINLIIEIKEGEKKTIKKIDFTGNNSFSRKLLLSKINSESLNFLNIFSSGSNINPSLFLNDVSLIRNFYINKGFKDVKVNYSIEKYSYNAYKIHFYIDENERLKIDNVDFNLTNKLQIDNKKFLKFKKNLSKIDNFYDFDLINNFVYSLNKDNSVEFNNYQIIFEIIKNENGNILVFKDLNKDLFFVNKININGNSITKNKTIRSKLEIQPGDYFDEARFRGNLNKLNKFSFINSSTYSYEILDTSNKVDIEVDINENIKTGNLFIAGTASGDTGLGLTLGAKDSNFLGSGNTLSSSFELEEDKFLFDLDYIQYPLDNSRLTNRYSIVNSEEDYTSSFGYKNQEQSISYTLSFDYSDLTRISTGLKYSNNKGFGQINNDSVIMDNIGSFQNSSIYFSLTQDKTNDFFFPNDGYRNSFRLTLSPDNISDNAYIKANLNTLFLNKFKNSNTFYYSDNNIGIADSLNGKLKTIDAYSLGGLSFKGFDYRGIGESNSNNIYLGGNKYFTTTIGLGTNFFFDDSDNLYLRFFGTAGSLWDSDYISNDFNLRSSIGASLDYITPIGPLSIYYGIPIQKEENDKTRKLNFSIGTSF
jgi:outer membrane protein insertion porin family